MSFLCWINGHKWKEDCTINLGADTYLNANIKVCKCERCEKVGFTTRIAGQFPVVNKRPVEDLPKETQVGEIKEEPCETSQNKS